MKLTPLQSVICFQSGGAFLGTFSLADTASRQYVSEAELSQFFLISRTIVCWTTSCFTARFRLADRAGAAKDANVTRNFPPATVRLPAA